MKFYKDQLLGTNFARDKYGELLIYKAGHVNPTKLGPQDAAKVEKRILSGAVVEVK